MNIKDRAGLYALMKETESDIESLRRFHSDNECDEAYSTGYAEGMHEVLTRLKIAMGKCMNHNAEWNTLWNNKH